MTKLDSTTYAPLLADAGITTAKLKVTIAKSLGADYPVVEVLRHHEIYSDAIANAGEIVEGSPWVSQRVVAQALVVLMTAGVPRTEAVCRVRDAVDADDIKGRLQAHSAWLRDPRQMTVAEQVAMLTG
jgi:hypothetical protein